MIVGIVADNYKLKKFNKELTKAGFTEYNTSVFTNESSTIQETTTVDRIKELKKLCQYVELHFKRSN